MSWYKAPALPNFVRGDKAREMLDFPRVEEGIRGMAFIDNVVASGKAEQKWTDFVV